jgi:hypothetical protein
MKSSSFIDEKRVNRRSTQKTVTASKFATTYWPARNDTIVDNFSKTILIRNLEKSYSEFVLQVSVCACSAKPHIKRTLLVHSERQTKNIDPCSYFLLRKKLTLSLERKKNTKNLKILWIA